MRDDFCCIGALCNVYMCVDSTSGQRHKEDKRGRNGILIMNTSTTTASLLCTIILLLYLLVVQD